MNFFSKQSMKILVVDDDPFTLELMHHFLRNLGYSHITFAQGGRAALTLIKGPASFDLLISDLQMPDMDGIELLRALKNIDYEGRLVLISGEDEDIVRTAEQLARVHGLRVCGHLRKPINPTLLAGMLRQQLDGAMIPSNSGQRQYHPKVIRQAIANRQLICYCQPKVSLLTGALVGVEVLARWLHPTDGLLGPNQFIGVAEQHGLIDQLTRAILRDSVVQTRAWLDAGHDIHTAINISMLNLDDLEFPDFLASLAKETEVPLPNIMLEITESRLLENMDAVLDVLARLRLKRVNLSIDDFGTGHSSLAQLRTLPFNELKIDRSFIRNANLDDRRAAICEASITIARRLGMRVAAEGIESLEEWRFLQTRKCEIGQGYLIGEPMPMTQLEEWLSIWKQRCDEMRLIKS